MYLELNPNSFIWRKCNSRNFFSQSKRCIFAKIRKFL